MATRPDFGTLPVATTDGVMRWVGSGVMDEEQYRIEGWYLERGWRATLDGLRAYSRLREQRRQDRRREFQTRQESDDEWSSHVASLIKDKA